MMVPGPVPAGPYSFDVYGYQQGNDAQVHFDVIHRSPGVPDRVVVSADGFHSVSDDGGLRSGSVGATVFGPAVDARCMDLFVLRIHYVAGSSPFLELFGEMSIP